jgi:hypothetical protein
LVVRLSATARSGSAQYLCIGIDPTTCTSTPIEFRSASRRPTEVSCGQTRRICSAFTARLSAEKDSRSLASSAACPGEEAASAFASGTSRCPCRRAMNARRASVTGPGPVSNSASTTASSAHIAAPWAISGGQACAASPITIALPRYRGLSTSSHSIRV